MQKDRQSMVNEQKTAIKKIGNMKNQYANLNKKSRICKTELLLQR